MNKLTIIVKEFYTTFIVLNQVNGENKNNDEEKQDNIAMF
jgi:hypothetical protein